MIPSFSIDQKDEQASRPPETADAPAAAQAPDARRAGALSPSGSDYLAASDVHRAQVFGRCPVQSGMARYRVARKVMSQTRFGSRTTIRLIEATKAVQPWRDQVPNGILTIRSTRACGGRMKP